MLTGELRSQVDALWNAFWSGGIANPIEVIEQITYLLFQRRLDDLHTLEENKAIRLGKPIERRVYPPGIDAKGRDYQDLRWSRFKNFAPAEMYTVVGEHVVHVHRVRAENPSAAVAHGTGYKSSLNLPVQARVCAQPVGMARGSGSRLGGTVLSIQATTALCM